MVEDETGAEGGLDGRRILVTGASSGIGEATARAAAAAGARVAGIARRTERLDRLAREIGLLPVVADLADEAAAEAAVTEAVDGLGGLDAVVNNAGLMRPGGILDGRPADWRLMLEVNVLGLLVVTRAAVPHLQAAGGGTIVNISSMSGRRVPNAASGVYSGTKHAVHAISEALRRELHGERIRVVVVSPGIVATEIADTTHLEQHRERMHRLQRELGLRPQDVARQVVRAIAEPPHVTLHEIALLPTEQD